MPRRACILLALTLLTASACDRESTAPVATNPEPVYPTLEIRPVAPLLAARRTNIAVDTRGNLFWSQENEGDVDDVVFSLGEDGVPRATGLTADIVLAQTREAEGAAVDGNIQSLAFGPDGTLYFFVSGGTDRRTIAALGRFIPAASKIELIAPTKQLMAAAGMGRSIALARGTVVASGGRVVLWLRHTDASVMLDVDTRAATIKRAPDVKTDAGLLRLTRENQFLAPGRDGSLLLLDLSSATLMRIDPAGKADVMHELAGLPQALSLPALDKRGRAVLFAGAGPTILPRTEEQAALSLAEYPAFVTLDGPRVHLLTRKGITAHSGFPVAGMKLQQLVLDRSNDQYVAYDESSGELLRLRVRGEVNP